jgi:exopolysaccharide production protein ExoZ
MKRESGAMLLNLNALRAFAALCVVFYHITSDAGLDLGIDIGTRGVDIFFVISGFIITYASSRSADQFFTRRLIRIVPFYWAATLAVFAIAAVLPNLFRSTQPDLVQLLCSLFFIPRETTYAGLFPTLILGWSLNYEMYFYVAFAIALAISARWAPVLCSAIIAAVLIAIDASGATHPSITFYTRGLVFEFVFGIAAFYVVRSIGQHRDAMPSRAIGIALLFLIAIVACVVLALIEHGGGYGLPRQLSSGVPAFFLVTSMILVEEIYAVSTRNRAVYLVGESSYILYLIHPYIVYGLLRTVFKHADGYGTATIVGLIVLLLAVATAIAVAIHLVFEKPLMEALRRRLLRPRVAKVADQLHEPHAKAAPPSV